MWGGHRDVDGLFAARAFQVVYWTVLAQAIAERGYQIRHDFTEYRRRDRAAERAARRYFQTIQERIRNA